MAYARAALLAAICFLTALTSALADKRVALVIGNAAYRHMPMLTNPKNDAEDVGRALRELGFETILKTDLDRSGMNEALDQFSRLADGADIALVYYAGHGMQFGGSNYLLPTEARLSDAADVNRFRLMPVSDVLETLKSARGARILVLDACRNNPVEDDLKRRLASLPGGNRNGDLTRGFHKISADGLLIAYATQANDVAKDGTGRNSPFTSAFLKHVATPDLDLRQMLFRVQDDVNRETDGKQRPELSISLVGEFKLKTAALPSNQGGVSPSTIEAERAWLIIKDTTSIPALDAFVRRFPDSFYADLARSKIEELRRAQPTQQNSPSAAKLAGASLSSITDDLRQRYKFKDRVRGVVIVGVDAGSDAADRGLVVGDVITQIASENVSSVPDVQRQIDKLRADGRRSILLRLENTDGNSRFVAVPFTSTATASAADVSSVSPDSATDCDRLAAPENWEVKGVAAVPFKVIDRVAAMRACNAAMQRYPGVARFVFLSGRVADSAGDYALARRLYEQAAATGHAYAMSNLGHMYKDGSGVKQDYAEARRWFEKAAAAGNPGAMGNVGFLHENGLGVPQDFSIARVWYEKGAAGGSSNSTSNLAHLYLHGRGVTQNYSAAHDLLQKAAALGHVSATFALGWLYAGGRGVTQDYAEARRWYEKAAAAGFAPAMLNLGILYEEGNGVARDYGEARRLYERSAADGQAAAMARLGNVYQKGMGVTADKTEARRWFEKASAAGDKWAADQLAALQKEEAGSRPPPSRPSASKPTKRTPNSGSFDDVIMPRIIQTTPIPSTSGSF